MPQSISDMKIDRRLRTGKKREKSQKDRDDNYHLSDSFTRIHLRQNK